MPSKESPLQNSRSNRRRRRPTWYLRMESAARFCIWENDRTYQITGQRDRMRPADKASIFFEVAHSDDVQWLQDMLAAAIARKVRNRIHDQEITRYMPHLQVKQILPARSSGATERHEASVRRRKPRQRSADKIHCSTLSSFYGTAVRDLCRIEWSAA